MHIAQWPSCLNNSSCLYHSDPGVLEGKDEVDEEDNASDDCDNSKGDTSRI